MNKTNFTLIGFQACGKTTIGNALSNHFKRTFVDTDRLIEKHHPGLVCSQIFHTFGEVYFRELESVVIEDLNQLQNTIIATGGGCLVNPDNGFKLQEHSTLIYLKIPFAMIKERIFKRPKLPAYLDPSDPHGSFVKIFQERSALYEHWADDVIHLNQHTPEQICQQIGERYGL